MHCKNFSANELRFIAKNGEIITSPENHLHCEVIKELHLSSIEGTEALVDVAQQGYAIITPLEKEVFIFYSVDELSKEQHSAIEFLRKVLEDFKITLFRDEA